MRVFLAGATGVIGVRLIPLLVEAGHTVAGLTRSQPDIVAALGAEPILGNVYEAEWLADAVRDFAPDLVLHQLTDLPDQLADVVTSLPANHRMRTEGTRNLLSAAPGARMIAQSIAFPPGADLHERAVLDSGGVVLRYGRFYGPGTWFANDLPRPPRIHVDAAARKTIDALHAPPGSVLEIVEEPQEVPAVGACQ